MKFIGFVLRNIIPISVLAVVGFLIYHASTPPTSGRIEGVGVDLLAAPPLTSEAVESTLTVLQQAGVDTVSIEVNWALVETTADVYNWSNVVPLDQFFTSAKSRGMNAVAVLTGYPLYLASPGDFVDEAVLGKRWEAFVRAAVDHFGQQVDTWQIGDQVNTTLAARSLAGADADLYAKMLRSASKIIRQSDANDKVWMGSLVSATADHCAVNPMTFLLEINAAKGWTSMDALTYQPRRGAALPEAVTTLNVNQACASSMTANPASLSTEVGSIQELARQLGGKPVFITGLNWLHEELATLQTGRTIDASTLHADLLVRGSTMLQAGNGVPLVLWQIDPLYQPGAMNDMRNINSLAKNARALGQVQGQSGSVQEYRFQKGATLTLLAWRSQDGDAAQPAMFSNLAKSKITAFSTDTGSLDPALGVPIEVDASGSAVVMLNERPVLISGKTGGWDEQLKALAKDQVDLWRLDLQEAIARGLNQLKNLLLDWLEDLFNQAKDSAVDWGENKIRDLLN